MCSYVCYPNHMLARMRAPCSSILMKTKKSSSGSEYLTPYKTYCYRSISAAIEHFLNRPFMVELCEKWRSKVNESGKLSDVYDGNMWNYFYYDSDDSPFFYLLMLNCDWFQPFKNTQFSVGVLYFAVQNLPREIRFKLENIIIVRVLMNLACL